ncbi:DNA circularization protein [Dyella lutea]|uniref:DNA circularization N-terminal domain-containing protein n=1 Tax=Dyella lutea TaxID=2950441 RepID=A0ABT1FDF5_9GAMM|nr:DNA circularization N-terminal domain-containing protein [Dyella lutea]MCP1375396.1 DNA circularization N-terminal domain-containing protein [Dyella lutea]
MSWRDELQPGSFRGVPFLIHDAQTQVGRRIALHEYPLRDTPWSEDLGRRARQFSIDCFVLGSDYMAQRDRLVTALEAAGPGTLVHPYRGTLRVVVLDGAEVSESTREGGMARFRIPFAEAGDKQEPANTDDTAAQLQSQASSTNDQLAHSFANQYSQDGMPQWVVDSTTSDLGGLTGMLASLRDRIPGIPSAVTAFNAQLQGFSNELSSLIRDPFNLGAGIVSLVVGLGTIVQQPLDALGLYTSLFDFGSDAAPIASTTPARTQQASNHAAVVGLVQGVAIAQAASWAAAVPAQGETRVQIVNAADGSASSSTTTGLQTTVSVAVDGYADIGTATAVRDEITAAIDTLSLTADDQLYPVLMDLRAATVRDINTRVAALPALVTFVPARTLPSIVLAYRLYDDATRDAEIVARNDLVYPGFAQGGAALEVLSE